MAEVDVMENRESDPTAFAAEATATGGGETDASHGPTDWRAGTILPDYGATT